MIDPNNVPADIIDAALKLERYFLQHNIREWKLAGVQSRVEAAQEPCPEMEAHEEFSMRSAIAKQMQPAQGAGQCECGKDCVCGGNESFRMTCPRWIRA